MMRPVDAIPVAELRYLDDAGHLVHIERSADANREPVRTVKSWEDRRDRITGGRIEKKEQR